MHADSIYFRDRYRQLCAEEASIPIFCQDWWLDATAGASWRAVIVEQGNEVQAAMPFVVRKKGGFQLIGQPKLTQFLGPWIRFLEAKYANQLSREKDLMQQLIDLLPPHAHFQQSWHYRYTNWLPFFWRGFSQTTKYTYRLNDLSNIEGVWNNLQSNIKREIKKAQNREGLKVVSDLPLSDFLDLNELVFRRQGKSLPYTRTLVERMDNEAQKRACRKYFIAVDQDGRKHAGVYLVWDEQSAYYLMGGGDPGLRTSGATSLCMWEAIKFASTVTRSFDFEGSMIEPVERFFRAFGSKQVPYHTVTHTPSRLFRAALFVRSRL